MTAPAEDPRSGEATLPCPRDGDPCAAICGSRRTCEFIRVANRPPAAGRGDTDSGGEAQCPPLPGEQQMHAAMNATPEQRAALQQAIQELSANSGSAGAQDHLELRSQLYGFLGDATSTADGDTWQHHGLQRLTERLLALPAVAALLDAQAAVNRVEAGVNRHADNLTPTQRAAFARALTGTTT